MRSGRLRDALAIEQAGAFAIVLECVPADLAQRHHREAGHRRADYRHWRGRPAATVKVLVIQDMLNMFGDLQPQVRQAICRRGWDNPESCRRLLPLEVPRPASSRMRTHHVFGK